MDLVALMVVMGLLMFGIVGAIVSMASSVCEWLKPKI